MAINVLSYLIRWKCESESQQHRTTLSNLVWVGLVLGAGVECNIASPPLTASHLSVCKSGGVRGSVSQLSPMCLV